MNGKGPLDVGNSKMSLINNQFIIHGNTFGDGYGWYNYDGPLLGLGSVSSPDLKHWTSNPSRARSASSPQKVYCIQIQISSHQRHVARQLLSGYRGRGMRSATCSLQRGQQAVCIVGIINAGQMFPSQELEIRERRCVPFTGTTS